MRELNFERPINYRTFALAVFVDEFGNQYNDVCVICEDYDDDDDSEYRWFRTLGELEAADDLVYLLGTNRRMA